MSAGVGFEPGRSNIENLYDKSQRLTPSAIGDLWYGRCQALFVSVT